MTDENEPLILDFEPMVGAPVESRRVAMKQVKALEKLWACPSSEDAEIPEVFLGPMESFERWSYPIPPPSRQEHVVVRTIPTQRITRFTITGE